MHTFTAKMALPFWLKLDSLPRETSENPPTHSLAMAAVDLTANPPVEIPAALQAGIDKLSSPFKTLLMGKVVPYIIQHRLGEDGYVTIEDLADCKDQWTSGTGIP